MMFLIMKCEPLDDQWECDANRIPLMVTADWHANIPKDCYFEVWEINDDGQIGKCIKDYETSMEQGMVFGYWDELSTKEQFIALKKYPNRTRENKCPSDVRKQFIACADVDNCLERSGYISGLDESNQRYYVYGEYFDNIMPHGC